MGYLLLPVPPAFKEELEARNEWLFVCQKIAVLEWQKKEGQPVSDQDLNELFIERAHALERWEAAKHRIRQH